MRTLCQTSGGQTSFIIADLDPAYHQVARDLVYSQVAEGFAKIYPADTPGLDQIYRSFARYAEPMMLQAAGAVPVPWEQALLAFLERVAGEPIDWWLGGSAALAVRGAAVAPRDFDLIVDDAGAQRLGALLQAELVEPVVPVQGWVCNWWGRAFLHARFEWVGGVNAQADQPQPSDFGPAAAARLETVQWHGHAIRVPPLDLQLQVSQRRGLHERAAQIQQLQLRPFLATWRLVAVTENGQPLPAESLPDTRVQIAAGQHTVTVAGQVVAQAIPFTIDMAAAPYRTTDLLPDGWQIHGITRLEGDTLISCVAPVGQPAPAAFVSEPGSGHILRVFQRVAG